MKEQIDTGVWVKKQFDTVKATAVTEGFDIKKDDFLSVTPLPNSMIAILGVEEQEDRRTVVAKIVPGFVLQYQDVQLDVFEPDDGDVNA